MLLRLGIQNVHVVVRAHQTHGKHVVFGIDHQPRFLEDAQRRDGVIGDLAVVFIIDGLDIQRFRRLEGLGIRANGQLFPVARHADHFNFGDLLDGQLHLPGDLSEKEAVNITGLIYVRCFLHRRQASGVAADIDVVHDLDILFRHELVFRAGIAQGHHARGHDFRRSHAAHRDHKGIQQHAQRQQDGEQPPH